MKKKLFLSAVLLAGLMSGRAVALGLSARDMYKVSCLPEMGEFRAEVVSALYYDKEAEWEKKLSDLGLRVLNAEVGAKTPAVREESCVLGGVAYRMKFRQLRQRQFLSYYDMGVQLFAGEKYLGILYPMGSGQDGRFEVVGIEGGKIFVEGCAVAGADSKYCKYDRREVEISDKTSYELALLEDDKVVPFKYNALEFSCYNTDSAAFGQVNLRFYQEGIALSDGYSRIEDEPVFKCGDVEMSFFADGEVHIRKGAEDFGRLKLDNCNKQVFQIRFPLEGYFDVGVTYFDKDEMYWRGTYCRRGEDCMACEMYH